MKIQQLLEGVEIEKGRMANPLGAPPDDIYDVMDEVYEVETAFFNAINKPNGHLPFDQRARISAEGIGKLGKHTKMSISDLIPMEPSLNIEHMQRELSNQPASVYLYKGKCYISDGNHRVAKAFQRGETHVVVNLIDVSDIARAAEEMGR